VYHFVTDVRPDLVLAVELVLAVQLLLLELVQVDVALLIRYQLALAEVRALVLPLDGLALDVPPEPQVVHAMAVLAHLALEHAQPPQIVPAQRLFLVSHLHLHVLFNEALLLLLADLIRLGVVLHCS